MTGKEAKPICSGSWSLRVISLLFCLFYPFLVVGSNSPLWPTELLVVNQAARHLLVIAVAITAFLAYREFFDVKSINASIRWVAAGVSISLFFLIIKMFYSATLPVTMVYAAVEPMLTLGAAVVISRTFLSHRHFNIMLFSFVISISFFTLLHFLEDLVVISESYNRARMVLGFMHPGKLAQHLTITFLLLLYFPIFQRRLAVFLTPVILMALGVLIIFTNTRTMILVLALAIIFKAISMFNVYSAKVLSVMFFFGLVISAVFLVSLIDRDSLYFLLSGRIGWWGLAINNNVQEFGWPLFLYGATTEPIPVIAPYLTLAEQGTVAAYHSFRMDNGYLESVVNNGIFVMFCYVIGILRLARGVNSNKDGRMALVFILLFFIAGESGLLAAGNSFGVIILIAITALCRIDQKTHPKFTQEYLLRHGHRHLPSVKLQLTHGVGSLKAS